VEGDHGKKLLKRTAFVSHHAGERSVKRVVRKREGGGKWSQSRVLG